MGDRTAIGWCHDTFNCWWGCVEVSPGCDNCYARELALRYGYEVWGHDGPRRFFGDDHWDEPMRWNRRAERTGVRERVFCMSMGDLGEHRIDAVGRELDHCRERLWTLIHATPYLDWLLLTKRADFYRRRVPRDILALPRVWPGVSVETPDYLWRVEHLRKLRAAGPTWISYEPALAPVNFKLMPHPCYAGPGLPHPDCEAVFGRKPGWLVIGGESGAKHRPFEIEWLSDAVGQCRAAGVPIFVKQDAGPRPGVQGRIPDELWLKEFPR